MNLRSPDELSPVVEPAGAPVFSYLEVERAERIRGRSEGAIKFGRHDDVAGLGWRKAAIWDRLMDAVVKAHDGKAQMIDSSIVRVH
ncbi:hypothetical protein ACFIOY_20035 [Bradyrhizobium sp. TZ2]